MNRLKAYETRKSRSSKLSKRIIYQMNRFQIEHSQQRSYPWRSVEVLRNETNLGARDKKIRVSSTVYPQPIRIMNLINLSHIVMHL